MRLKIQMSTRSYYNATIIIPLPREQDVHEKPETNAGHPLPWDNTINNNNKSSWNYSTTQYYIRMYAVVRGGSGIALVFVGIFG